MRARVCARVCVCVRVLFVCMVYVYVCDVFYIFCYPCNYGSMVAVFYFNSKSITSPPFSLSPVVCLQSFSSANNYPDPKIAFNENDTGIFFF